MIGVPDWRYSRGEGAVKINRLHYTPLLHPPRARRVPPAPPGGV